MNNQDSLQQLWDKYLADQKMTAGELKQLRSLVQNPQHQQQLDQLLATLYAEEQPLSATAECDARAAYEEAWARVQTSAPETTQAAVVPLHARRWWRYAAAILVISAATGGAYQLFRSKAPVATPPLTAHTTTLIQPGGNKATLTLADGSVISLNEAQNGALAQQGNTQVVKTAGGQLAYQAKGATGSTVLYNTIQTPRGGRFHITLPDGSKVWLNAASSLYYPTAFTGSSREVTLTGEAYFEIAPNTTQPFKVLVNTMQVNVLGTHFNIMAYTEEAAIQTTLLQGSVAVTTAGNKQLLKPGQRASLNRNTHALQVQEEVDTEEVIAWKNGQVQFAGADLHAAMRMIERWYDVEVEYKGSIPNAHFRGSLPSTAPITDMLNMMQQTGEVHFEIKGRKIMVTP